MKQLGPLVLLRRNLEFGRHIGLKRLARRLELNLRRALYDRARAAPYSEPLGLAPARSPPLPLLAPRTGMLQHACGSRRFTFLNRTIELAKGTWRSMPYDPRDQLWRMCLHYMEYLEAVDDTAFEELVNEWIAHNHPRVRGAWRDSFNGYAVSLRTVVWMQQLARRRDRLSPVFVDAARASLGRQLAFLERNLETDLGGNHFVKNIKALIWASAYFAGEPAARWRRKGLAALGEELGRQILPDGMHEERSPSYHCQVLADLLECRHALEKDPFGGQLDSVLDRMAQVAIDMAHPDGRVAQFNDAGLNMAYAPDDCLDAFERLFCRRPIPRAVFALPHAGYYGLRVGDTYFIADCGRVAPDDLPAHAHGDVLSFEWSVAGHRMIIDQGVFEYNVGARRQKSREALAHNTLGLNGADQADFFGAFRCGRRPDVEVRCYEAGANTFVLEGMHDGFAYLPGRPRHVRRFDVRTERVEIDDRIEGSTDCSAAIRFLLHPDCHVEVSGQSAKISRGKIAIELMCDAPLRAEVAVWWPDMGVEQATKRLVAELAPGVRTHVSRFEVARVA